MKKQKENSLGKTCGPEFLSNFKSRSYYQFMLFLSKSQFKSSEIISDFKLLPHLTPLHTLLYMYVCNN